MTTKQRAYLKGLAMTMDPIFQIGKNSMTPEFTTAIAEALENRQSFRTAQKKAIMRTMKAGAKGCKVQVSGVVDGANTIARKASDVSLY